MTTPAPNPPSQTLNPNPLNPKPGLVVVRAYAHLGDSIIPILEQFCLEVAGIDAAHSKSSSGDEGVFFQLESLTAEHNIVPIAIGAILNLYIPHPISPPPTANSTPCTLNYQHLAPYHTPAPSTPNTRQP